MISDPELTQIYSFARNLTCRAGDILLDQFHKPREITYKSENRTNPVTDADRRVEDFLKSEIEKEFDGHALLAEETESVEKSAKDFTWVIDPLDGTVNFLNGLPVFGVSVGVLRKGKPVIGCIFLPSAQATNGDLFHAISGGGAFRNDVPISVLTESRPRNGAISIFPKFWMNKYRFKSELSRSLGELRALGSVAYELAMTASGVIQYSFFGSPWAWDVSAGLVLVKEAQGMALFRDGKSQLWKEFQSYQTIDGGMPSPKDIKDWRPSWICGNGDIIEFVTTRIDPKSGFEIKIDRIRDLWRR
jgi:myo-inositol-1(or 4)-monophosphatase